MSALLREIYSNNLFYFLVSFQPLWVDVVFDIEVGSLTRNIAEAPKEIFPNGQSPQMVWRGPW